MEHPISNQNGSIILQRTSFMRIKNETVAGCKILTSTMNGYSEYFLNYGLLMPLFCIFLAIFNIVMRFVALRNRRNLPAPKYVYLASLASWHAVALIFEAVIFAGLHFAGTASTGFYAILFQLAAPNLLIPFWNFAAMAATLVFVTMTVETYFHTKRPAMPRNIDMLTSLAVMAIVKSNSRRIRAKYYRNGAIIAAALIAIPRYFSLKMDFSNSCFEPRWSSAFASWYQIYTAIFLSLMIGAFMIAVIFHFLKVSVLCERISNNKIVRSQQQNPARLEENSGHVCFTTMSLILTLSLEMVQLSINPATVVALPNEWQSDYFMSNNVSLKLWALCLAGQYSAMLVMLLATDRSLRGEMKRRLCAIRYDCCGGPPGYRGTNNNSSSKDEVMVVLNNNVNNRRQSQVIRHQHRHADSLSPSQMSSSATLSREGSGRTHRHRRRDLTYYNNKNKNSSTSMRQSVMICEGNEPPTSSASRDTMTARFADAVNL